VRFIRFIRDVPGYLFTLIFDPRRDPAYSGTLEKPQAQGFTSPVANCPALWTDGQTWPQDGEVDVMEALGPNNDDRRNDVREEREGRMVLLERLREIDEEIARLRDVRRTVQEEYMNYLDHNDV
jgi:hypothetical protein